MVTTIIIVVVIPIMIIIIIKIKHIHNIWTKHLNSGGEERGSGQIGLDDQALL